VATASRRSPARSEPVNNPAKKKRHTEKNEQSQCCASEGILAPRRHVDSPRLSSVPAPRSWANRKNPAIEVAGFPDGKARAGGLGAFPVRVINRPRRDWFPFKARCCQARPRGGLRAAARSRSRSPLRRAGQQQRCGGRRAGRRFGDGLIAAARSWLMMSPQ
jgi:hypothetical protein